MPFYERFQADEFSRPILGAKIQKIPRVRKFFVRNSGAGNGCANFMGACKECVCSAERTMSIKFLVLGGGYLGFLGGKCQLYFYGCEDFSEKYQCKLFLYKVFREPFGSWTSAPKIVDVRPHQKVPFFCGIGDGEKLFDLRASGRKGQECAQEIRAQKFMFTLFFLSVTPRCP